MSSQEDDAFLRVEPGSTADVAIHLPRDHPGGLYWYHPHGHGGATVQAFNGLAGLIVVPGDLEDSLAPFVVRPAILLPVQELALVSLGNESRRDASHAMGTTVLPPGVLGFDPAAFACSGAARGGGFQYMGGWDLKVSCQSCHASNPIPRRPHSRVPRWPGTARSRCSDELCARP